MVGLNAVVTDLKEQNNRETTVQKLLEESSFLKWEKKWGACAFS